MKEKSTENTMEIHKATSAPVPFKAFAACFVLVCVAAVL